MRKFLQKYGLQLLTFAAVTAAAYVAGFLNHPAGWGAPLLGMAISFSSIPNTLRLPFVAAEFDNSLANQGAAQLAYRVLIIGQKTSAGTATANTILPVTSADQVRTYGGAGSMLHRMAMAYFSENSSTETYIGVLSDNGAGVAASGTLTVTGPATAAGTLSLYIGGTLVEVAVASGDAQNSIASAINTAINADTTLPVTSSVTTNVVTVTAKNKGTCGNDIDMRLNYVSGQSTPAGVAVAIVAMASGATNPTLTSLISAMGDNTWFQIVAHPYTDATSLTALENEFHSRFGPMRMVDALGITCGSGTYSTLAALGVTRNSQHNVIASMPGKSPVTPAFEAAAAIAGVKAYYASIDPAAPDQTLEVSWIKAPADGDLFTNSERNLLLFDGIGTTRVISGKVQLERLITTYRTNSAGAADVSYMDSTTMLTLMYLRYTWRNLVLSKYGRFKLANDGTRVGAGQKVITPKGMKAECLNWFRQMEELGLVENFDAFKTNLVVQRNATDVNRLDVLLPPDIINQLIVTAANIQFRL